MILSQILSFTGLFFVFIIAFLPIILGIKYIYEEIKETIKEKTIVYRNMISTSRKELIEKYSKEEKIVEGYSCDSLVLEENSLLLMNNFTISKNDWKNTVILKKSLLKILEKDLELPSLSLHLKNYFCRASEEEQDYLAIWEIYNYLYKLQYLEEKQERKRRKTENSLLEIVHTGTIPKKKTQNGEIGLSNSEQGKITIINEDYTMKYSRVTA